MGRYINYISETGRRYDIARHVKRTSKYFAPSEIVFNNTSDEEDNKLKENEVHGRHKCFFSKEIAN